MHLEPTAGSAILHYMKDYIKASTVPILIVTSTPYPRWLRKTHCNEWHLFTNLRRDYKQQKKSQVEESK